MVSKWTLRYRELINTMNIRQKEEERREEEQQMEVGLGVTDLRTEECEHWAPALLPGPPSSLGGLCHRAGPGVSSQDSRLPSSAGGPHGAHSHGPAAASPPSSLLPGFSPPNWLPSENSCSSRFQWAQSRELLLIDITIDLVYSI